MSKTQAEIDDLKRQWAADPCWDIEETEGFEAHKAELIEFRKMIEKQNSAVIRREREAKRQMWNSLYINEGFTLPNGDYVLRVPGGWVLTTYLFEDGYPKSLSTVFIPMSPL